MLEWGDRLELAPLVLRLLVRLPLWLLLLLLPRALLLSKRPLCDALLNRPISAEGVHARLRPWEVVAFGLPYTSSRPNSVVGSF
jgi:hypothetical protein